MPFSLSERDKKLLLLLLIVAIICIPFFLYIQPTMEKNQKLEAEISELGNYKSQLEQLAMQGAYYQEDLGNIIKEKEAVFGRFPSGLPQEASIIFIYTTERAIPIRLYQVSFGEDVAAQITSEEEEKAIKVVEEATGDATQTEVIDEVVETTSLGGGLQGISTATQFTYMAGYQEFKDFLNYIQNYQDRMVITELNANYLAESDTVSGSFKLLQYAIAGPERLPVEYVEPTMLQGTTNIFMEAAGNFGEVKQDAEEADFFLMLSQPDANVDAKIVGKSGDAGQISYLTNDDNSEQEIKITFEGKSGDYKAHYSIGKKSYDKAGVTFEKEGSINLEILSSPRVGDKDKVAAKISIVNDTDITVHVKVVDDDTENPRVNIMGKTGAILMK